MAPVKRIVDGRVLHQNLAEMTSSSKSSGKATSHEAFKKGLLSKPQYHAARDKFSLADEAKHSVTFSLASPPSCGAKRALQVIRRGRHSRARCVAEQSTSASSGCELGVPCMDIWEASLAGRGAWGASSSNDDEPINDKSRTIDLVGSSPLTPSGCCTGGGSQRQQLAMSST